ncbi:BTAD domain-containing putative transcriptional regulator [Streptomyces sp. NPDC047072]|uniref:AfsR/SARP family transcriptional regulator n=1 Tax=Streptomyces sp. NPDC047072 TaxID=3154809 RepID=UPI0033FDDB7D
MEESGLEGLRFALLGPLRGWRGDVELGLGSPQQRAVLAMLVLRRGHAVGIAELVDGVWGERAPAGAVSMVRTYVSRLRKVLAPGRPSEVLVSVGDGYTLRKEAVTSDLVECEDAVARAKRQLDAGDGEFALRLLRQALGVWESPALAGVPGPHAESARADLAERRLGALELRLRVELGLGRHEAVVAELLTLRDAHPLRESVSELLLLALYRCGRQADALEAYARTRRTLVDELGIEPGPALRELQGRILAGDPSLIPVVEDTGGGRTGPAVGHGSDSTAHNGSSVGDDGNVVGEDTGSPPGGTGSHPPDVAEGVPGSPQPVSGLLPPAVVAGIARARPSQLPADLALFTGRRYELDCAETQLGMHEATASASSAAPVAVLDGMAGAGKTTLAVHFAHRIADRYPDGSLYVNLRGYDPGGSRTDPAVAVEAFLVALGVAPHDVPEGLDARAALYRSVLADRRVLIVLDNARDSEQVQPLLPSAPGCLVIVTSRSRLSGLVARHGARPLTLGLLSAEDGRELLARRLGEERVAREPEAADAIIELCARLPLALSVVAARAAHHPGFRLTDIVAGLRDDHGSLDAFVGDDAGFDVRTVFSWSYHALSPEAAALFRHLALHPGPDVSVAAAAALAGVERRRVRALLGELTGASLLIEHRPGRFVFHDLVRAYAGELAESEDEPDVRRAALVRMHDHFLCTAHNASSVLDPFRELIALPPGTTDVARLRFDDRADATAWLRAERYVLRAAVAHAAAHGFDEHTWRTVCALDVYFNRLGYWHDLVEMNGAALRSAEKVGDVVGQAYSLCGLGVAHSQLHHAEPSLRHLERSLELFRQAGDRAGQARAHRGLAYLANRTDRRPAALGHYAEARDLYRAEHDLNGEAGVLNQVAWTYILIGEHASALDKCEKAVALYEEMGDPYGEASTQDTLGYALHHLGRYAAAVERFEVSAELFHRIGDRYLEADVRRHLCDSHRAAGDLNSARMALGSALALLEEIGHGEAVEVREALRELDAVEREGTD